MSIKREFIQMIRDLPVSVLESEPMSRHTSFEIGGPAEALVIAKSTDAIPAVLRAAHSLEMPVRIIGNGSNLLAPDEGLPGVTLKIAGECAGCELYDPDTLRSQAGTLMKDAAVYAAAHDLSGMEGLSGIPGTVGGGVYMNAGAYEREMCDIVIKTVYCDMSGAVHTLEGGRHEFGYRQSFFKNHPGCVILETFLKLKAGKRADIEALCEEYARQRREKQPLDFPSAGSAFKRPPGMFAGKLIDDCGLRGTRIGGAQISPKHAGFIINAGGASAGDVTALIAHVQKTVLEKFGVLLESEIQVL